MRKVVKMNCLHIGRINWHLALVLFLQGILLVCPTVIGATKQTNSLQTKSWSSAVWAVVRISHDGTIFRGGRVAGSGFFISTNTFVTVHHVLNRNSFIPETRESVVDVYLVHPFLGQIHVNNVTVSLHPHKDLTIISFKTAIQDISPINRYSLKITPGMPIHCGGYFGEIKVEHIERTGNRINVQGLMLTSMQIHSGQVRFLAQVKINANDIRVENAAYIFTDFSGIMGLSGAPLGDLNGNLVGVMSIRLPKKDDKKQRLGAVSVRELLRVL